MRKLIYTGLLAAVAAFAAVSPANAQQTGGTLTIAHNAAMGTTDPHFTQGQPNSAIYPHVFEMLLTVGEDMSPTPQLAESYEISEDGLTYTFRLREGVPFHNGKIMDSGDVLASWQRYKDKSPNGKVLDPVVEMSAPDAATFVIRLAEPSPLLLEALVSPTFPLAIMPAEEAAKEEGQIDPIGTGPYKYGEVVLDDQIVLERFDDYAAREGDPEGFNGYSGKRQAYLDTIVFKIVPEASTRASALEAGTMQFTSLLPINAQRRLVDSGKFQDVTFLASAKTGYTFHTKNGASADLKFRQAVQAATDLEEIMAIAWEGIYALDPSFLFASSPYYNADNIREFYNIADTDKAKALLAESAYDGEEIIILAYDYPDARTMALVLREQLQAIGIKAEVNITDFATWVQNVTEGTGNWHINVVGYGSQPLSGPASYFAPLRTHAQIGEDDEVINTLSAEFLTTADIEARAEIWQKFERHMFEQAYYMIGGDRGMTLVAANELKNFKTFYSQRFWNTWFE